MHTLKSLSVLEVSLWYSTDTRRSFIVHVSALYTPRTAQLLVSLFLPFGYQIGVCIALLHQPIVKFLGYLLTFVVQVEYICGMLIGATLTTKYPTS